MRLQRTANAGVLLELDGKKILLDGVCREVSPYPATPRHIRQALQEQLPDMVAVTHFHQDHYDMDYCCFWEKATGRSVITSHSGGQTVMAGDIAITAVPSRHIGKFDCPHVSFLIEGSKRVWFMGDAAPSQWKNREEAADLLIAPFAYAATEAAWKITREIAPNIVIVHLPEKGMDTLGLRHAVLQTAGERVWLPELEEQINF